ncbi:MFS transporter [Acinetobacter soli]|uniref:MFS transporter n=1 Tax=Acinetobacter soli TaxID=487316 RepID=UPI00124FDE71|nr:MFS transporter [Acinetobacter soli]
MRTSNIHAGIRALAITSFAIGLAEFIIVGVLPTIAQEFNTSISTTGKLVGFYALALAVGTPILILCLSHLNRKIVLLSLVALFIVGNLISLLATNYLFLLAGRMITAVAHGSFFALGASIATHLVAKEQAGRAIATMFSGLTLAMVLGVPIGSLIGNLWGWRIPLYAVIIFAIIGFIFTLKEIPNISLSEKFNLRLQLSTLAQPCILLMLALTVFSFGASFTTFTFINPVLVQITGFTQETASLLLIVFGFATFLGNHAGGHLTVKIGWQKSLLWFCCVLFITFAALYVCMTSKIFMIGLIFIWGILAFGLSPVLQAGVLSIAQRYRPRSIDFASALNISAFNLGITLGEILGSFMISQNKMNYTPLAGILMICLAFMCLWQLNTLNKTQSIDQNLH